MGTENCFVNLLFGRVAAYTGIVANILAYGLYVPVIGVALSTISGIAYLVWFLLIIRRLFQLAAAPRAANATHGA